MAMRERLKIEPQLYETLTLFAQASRTRIGSTGDGLRVSGSGLGCGE
jgi:hypothetical protein